MPLMTEQFECRAYNSSGKAADGRFSYAGSTPHYAPDRTFDTRHIRLEVALDFSRKTLKGECVTTLRSVADQATRMVFDAVDFKDVKVSARGKALKFENSGRQIIVHWPSPISRGTTVDVAMAA